MSFIDTLKALLGFSVKKEIVEENIVVAETPVVPMQEVQTPIEENPEEKIIVSEPVVDTMEADMNTELPVIETPVETVVETTTTTENQ
jgi:hypothetical protein